MAGVRGWRAGTHRGSHYSLRSAGKKSEVAVVGSTHNASVTVDDEPPVGASVNLGDGTAEVQWDSVTTAFHFSRQGDLIYLAQDGASWTIEDVQFERRMAESDAAEPDMRSPMPGAVVAIMVDDGDVVEAGTAVLSIEAMKMENELRSKSAGTVKTILVSAGTAVEKGTVLVELE